MNRLDISLRQMPDPKTQKDKTGDDISEFKKMMKQKEIKKDNGPEKKDKKQNPELSAQEAAASTVAANQGKEPSVVDPKDTSIKKAVLALETVNSAKNLNEESADWGQSDAMDSIQFLKEMRLKNWTAGEQGIKQTGEELKVSPKDTPNMVETAGPNHVSLLEQGEKPEGKTKVNAKNPEELVGPGKQVGIKEMSSQMKALLVGDQTDETALKNKGPGSHEEMGNNSSKEDEKDQIMNVLENKSYSAESMPHIQKEKEVIALTPMQVEDSEDLKEKLTDQMLKQIHKGNKNLELQLEPHNLGKIQLKVTYEDNQVNVSVVCTETRTLKMLTHSASELGAILEHNLERPVHIIVDESTNDYLKQQSENQGNSHGQSQQESHSQTQDKRDDFFQKLRLGLFDADLDERNETIYR